MAAAERTKWTAAEKEEEKAIMTAAKQQEDGATKQDFPKVGEQRQRQKNDRMVVKNIADLTALISV